MNNPDQQDNDENSTIKTLDRIVLAATIVLQFVYLTWSNLPFAVPVGSLGSATARSIGEMIVYTPMLVFVYAVAKYIRHEKSSYLLYVVLLFLGFISFRSLANLGAGGQLSPW